MASISKRLYRVHSSVGIVFGLLMYVVCLTGTVAVLIPDMTEWEMPQARVEHSDTIAVDPLVRQIAAEDGDFDAKLVFAELPHDDLPALRLWRPTRPYRSTVDVLPGQDQPIRWTPGWGEFHRRLHTNLHIPGPLGRWMIGFIGVAMLLTLVTGIVSDRGWRSDRMTVRPEKSTRILMADFHKRIGLWALPFSATISLSGALLGLFQIVLAVAAIAAFQGDTESALAAVVGEQTQRAEVRAEMVDIDPLIEDARERLPGPPTFIGLHYYGDENARIAISTRSDTSIADFSEVQYSLTDGHFIRETWSLDQSAGSVAIRGLFDLHYGSFGGISLRVIYFALGSSMSAMAGLGLSLWLRRLALKRKKSGGKTPWLQRFNTGVVAGMPLATAVSFAAVPLVGPHPSAMVLHMGIYFASLILATLFALHAPVRNVAPRMWTATGGLLLGGLVIDAVQQGGALPGQFAASAVLPAIYAFAAGLGVIIIVVARRAHTRG